MATAEISLEDRYAKSEGRVLMNGIQALVRLPMMQREHDRSAGFKTAGLISGYRGSPLGGYDAELLRESRRLSEHDIVFQPGLNEDLAATAVWGTQQTDIFGDATVDGVFGIWYGKGPGVSRSMDVLKHANFAGCSRLGGVLAIVGDDHGCQSSTMPHQSDQELAAALIPTLCPADPEEILRFGLLGFALSRFASCWVALKLVVDTVEATSVVDVALPGFAIARPMDFILPPGGLGIRWPDTGNAQEARIHGPKMAAVQAFVDANPVDRIVVDSPQPRFGIAAVGKAYLDVREALDRLGLDDAAAAAAGIRLYRVGLAWPLARKAALAFADGLEEILVVEEKRAFVEDQFARLLSARGQPTRVVGKEEGDASPLLPTIGELRPEIVAAAIQRRLAALGIATPKALATSAALPRVAPAAHKRIPFYCSGCPHNRSTVVPEGSTALAGIGCHGMATWMPGRHAAVTSTHMGGEGLTWVGRAPFSKTKHVFQNLGDGTYSHSGLLAIRAAAASGVNITYKILFNDAVAMTGGQAVEGQLTVPQITHQVQAEGARSIVIVTDDPEKYSAGTAFAQGTRVFHRDDLDKVQRMLREIEGLSILIYDQTCAAEKRRRRKRGSFPDPDRRLFINAAVCEGCGDCSRASNCISVQPLDTPLGRKRAIDQSSCNKDFSCQDGFCPSFVTVRGARLRKDVPATASDLNAALPDPIFDGDSADILVTGIGGTGVITIGQILGMAARIDGQTASVLDLTGLAQKNGAVMSHVRLGSARHGPRAPRLSGQSATLVIGCDAMVAASEAALTTFIAGRTNAVVNSDIPPPTEFIEDGAVPIGTDDVRRALREGLGREPEWIATSSLAARLLGNTIGANMMAVGFAWQRGWIPIAHAAIDRAIELNGAAVAMNREAFRLGRIFANDPALAGSLAQSAPRPAPMRLGELVDDFHRRLTAYQDRAYADEFAAFVTGMAGAIDGRSSGEAVPAAVARSLFKLMAYKDEYEVARLYCDPEFRAALAAQFEGDYRLEVNLAPPLLARKGSDGIPRKLRFGPWIFGLFALLRRLKRLRGTAFDPFGYTGERRAERALIARYRDRMTWAVARLGPDTHALILELAELPLTIRGFGHVKAAAIEKFHTREAELVREIEALSPLIGEA